MAQERFQSYQRERPTSSLKDRQTPPGKMGIKEHLIRNFFAMKKGLPLHRGKRAEGTKSRP